MTTEERESKPELRSSISDVWFHDRYTFALTRFQEWNITKTLEEALATMLLLTTK